MRWMGIYTGPVDVWVMEAMITVSRRFKVWPEYVLPSGSISGTWNGNLGLIYNHVSTILRRYDDIQGVTIILPEQSTGPDFVRTHQNIGAVAATCIDRYLKDKPTTAISESLLVKFTLGQSSKDYKKKMIDRALKEYNYKHQNEGAVMAFWASMFCAAIDYPSTEKFRSDLIDKFKKSNFLE